MTNNKDVRTTCSASCGAISGAFVGLGLGIWASVKYLEPAFDEMHGINDKGAKALTALVGVVAVSFLACCYCYIPTANLSIFRSTIYTPSNETLDQLHTSLDVIAMNL